MSNCLLFALRKRWAHGGYLITRKSHYGWWPHFLWSPDLITFEQYVPDEKAHARYFPPLLFRGRVKIGPDDGSW